MDCSRGGIQLLEQRIIISRQFVWRIKDCIVSLREIVLRIFEFRQTSEEWILKVTPPA